MGDVNTLWATRIRYERREYAMRYANTLWATRIRYTTFSATIEFAVHNASVGLAQARPNYSADRMCYVSLGQIGKYVS